jgi:multidrug efflux pump subunit AcrB
VDQTEDRGHQDQGGAALAGIVWMLFATGTTLSVPALTAAIMCMGIATANCILVISFAREQLEAVLDAIAAAFEAGRARFRPVLMTALAMVIGMLPMAIEPGQNAPLGRAVIGGFCAVRSASPSSAACCCHSSLRCSQPRSSTSI